MDGKFDWIGKNWNISMKYLPETLVSKCIAKNPDFNVKLNINEGVHFSKDIFIVIMLGVLMRELHFLRVKLKATLLSAPGTMRNLELLMVR
jgi:hypothetical protein